MLGLDVVDVLEGCIGAWFGCGQRDRTVSRKRGGGVRVFVVSVK